MLRDYEKLLKAGNKAQLEKLKEKENIKGGWDDIDLEYAAGRIEGELEELYMALDCEDEYFLEEIRREAADIANFAHMIILRCDKFIKAEKKMVKTVRKCQVCGCTDNDCSRCIERTGYACYWVEDDLCSACVEDK